MPELVEMGLADAAGGGAAGGHAEAPDVSFIVGAYDVAPYIEAAVRSALAQTGAAVEVIVVDDASRDATGDVVAALAAADPRVKLVRKRANAGLSAARNSAIDIAAGRWLAVLDGDDTLSPERSRRLLDLAEATGADMVADNFECVAEDGTPLGRTMIPRATHPHAFHLDLAEFVLGNIFLEKRRMSYGAIKPMFRADFVRSRRLRYYEDPSIRHEDFLFDAEALLAGARFVVTSEAMYQYRQRASSISFRITAAQIAAMQSANAARALHVRAAHDPRAAAAMDRYDAAMARARRLVAGIEAIKRRDIREAVRACGLRADLLPLLARFGAEGMMRRASVAIGRLGSAGRSA